jgi:alkylhydroperoxidase/carboxymuconolactone decarboxylase family protein YurZ
LSKAKEVTRKYHSFYQSAHEEGVLDLKTKKLLHLATVLALRCEH